MAQTEEQKRETARRRYHRKKLEETPEQREVRLAKQREKMNRYRLAMTPEERAEDSRIRSIKQKIQRDARRLKKLGTSGDGQA
jgi:hypothetical protein